MSDNKDIKEKTQVESVDSSEEEQEAQKVNEKQVDVKKGNQKIVHVKTITEPEQEKVTEQTEKKEEIEKKETEEKEGNEEDDAKDLKRLALNKATVQESKNIIILTKQLVNPMLNISKRIPLETLVDISHMVC